MEKEPTAKENGYENQLLTYIDVPYFRNNPSYIELWRRYYNSNPNPHILLLMYHKSISTFYHWIYIELAEHFLRIKEPELAHFILCEALRNGVYNPTCLEKALSRIPIFKKKYTRGDMLCILDQKNILALGTVWNKYEEIAFCDIHLDSLCMSFEMAKAREYFSEIGIRSLPEENSIISTKTIKHTSDSSFFQTEFFSDCCNFDTTRGVPVENLSPECLENIAEAGRNLVKHGWGNGDLKVEGVSEIPADKELSVNAVETNETEGDKHPKSLGGSDLKRKLEENAEVYNILKSPAIEPEFIVGGYVHVLQESNDDHFVVIRIANDADITQTIAGKTYFMKIIRYEEALLLSGVKKYEFCVVSDTLYVIYELDKLGTLSDILNHCNNLTCLHYLGQTLSLIREFSNKGINLNSLNFAVNTNFDIVLTDFDLTKSGPESFKEAVDKLLSQYFSRFELSLKWDSIETDLKAKMLSFEFRRAMLRHKADVLNNL
ncbi:hypothetical protein PAEPH01_1166 [Pancytospora epiphaga]|nr:hypothetical protein PAEPH01_1166 [Pancytospora epiphaga]